MLCNYYCSINKKAVKVGNKTIGYLSRDRFIKPVIGSKHRLKCPPAWAIDAQVFDSEVMLYATEIVIKDKETGNEYHASVDKFNRLKGELDRGFGRQYFLTLNHWEERGDGHRQLSLWKDVK